MGQSKNQLRVKGQGTKSQNVGGREFGNVIEPMQAQMASGNKGLTDDSGKQPPTKKPMRKKKVA